GTGVEEVLQADERCAVTGRGEQLGGVPNTGVQPPAERRVCEAQNARGLRVHAGVERSAARAALRRGTEAGGEANAARGQAIQGRRRDRRLPAAAEMLPEVVAGQEEDAARQAVLSLWPRRRSALPGRA